MTGGFPSQRASDAKMFPFDDVIMIYLRVVTRHAAVCAVHNGTLQLVSDRRPGKGVD